MKWENDVLRIKRDLSEIDEKVIEFIEILEDESVDYVIISGYVAILAGRSRGTEDIDLIIEELSKKEAEKLADRLAEEGYWCINAELDDIYSMLSDNLSVRIAEEGKAIPNFELAFQQDRYDRKALEEKLEVDLGENLLFISPLELQIAYKLYLGSEKDFEDALHLYTLFDKDIDTEKLENLAKELGTEEDLDELRNV